MSTLTSRSQLLPNIAVLFANIPLLIGINGLLRPGAVLASVDFPASTTPEAEKLAHALLRLVSARNITVGLICSGIWYRGDRKLFGYALMSVSFFPLVDSLISLDLIGGGLSNHLPAGLMSVGLGAGLLGWLG